MVKNWRPGKHFCSHCGQDVAAAETSVAATSTNAVPAADADGLSFTLGGILTDLGKL